MARAPNLLERAAFRTNLAPALLLDVLGAATVRVVHAALRRGLFEALREGPRSAGDVARALGTDPRATRIWLDALAAAGYLRRRGGAYANTPMVRRWLLRDQPAGMAPLLTFWEEVVFPFWREQLDTAMERGAPAETIYAWMDRHPGTWEVAQAWFAASARGAAPEVVRRAALPAGAGSLLDVGGGHGVFSVAFCQARPGLRATVLDLPQPLAAARATVAAAGLGDRVALRAADYARDDLGRGHDAALLFNILHAHLPAQNVALLRRVRAALAPGGVLLVLEQLRGPAPGPVVKALVEVVGLNYLAVLGGQAYTRADLAAWLREAGFAAPRFRALRTAPGNTLVAAARPA